MLTKVMQLDYVYLVTQTIIVKLISQHIHVLFKPLVFNQNVHVH
jgi:hypothetical protein